MAKREQVLITRDTVVKGERVKAGKKLTVDEADARLLESCNKAARGKPAIEAAEAEMKAGRAPRAAAQQGAGQQGTGQG